MDNAPSRAIRALLFADVKGYSCFSERDCIIFRAILHEQVARDILAPHSDAILTKGTWGDALHVVLNCMAEAGRLALDLQNWMKRTDWGGAGLSVEPKLRVSLHAGLVTRIPNAISGGFDYVGRNTSRAARIEPITFEGQVFASGAYAALLALEDPPDIAIDYVGVRALPKGAGTIPVFLLSRKKQLNANP
ncbi:MAG: hypothetical protein IKO40_00710 [Kiritimatiellae bacterium]|nr:hypothetical protein [Kiritimatiellia bacterium]